jgi:hypothetical protein
MLITRFLAYLNRFKVNQNLVINMVLGVDAADWVGSYVAERVNGLVWSGSLGGIADG